MKQRQDATKAQVSAVNAGDDEERKLLLSMGWNPDDDDDEGGLEEWEIDAAQESLVEHLQQGQRREGFSERAQREFEAWKAEQGANEDKSLAEKESGSPAPSARSRYPRSLGNQTRVATESSSR